MIRLLILLWLDVAAIRCECVMMYVSYKFVENELPL